MTKQIKSKHRVTEFGEVNTSFQTIENIIDLVGNEAMRYDSKFLDPAMGMVTSYWLYWIGNLLLSKGNLIKILRCLKENY